MRWSQLRTRIEDRLAASLQGRVQFHNARYRHSHDQEGRGWITVDGKQVLDAATLSAWQAELADVEPQLRELRMGSSVKDYEASSDATARIWRDAIAHRQSQDRYTLEEFNEAIEDYLQLTLDQALDSPNTLQRSLAYLDRRLGHRRFLERSATPARSVLEESFRRLRAEAEGWKAPDASGLTSA